MKYLFQFLFVLIVLGIGLFSCNLSSDLNSEITEEELTLAKTDSFISVLAIDENDMIWMGSYKKGLKKFDGIKTVDLAETEPKLAELSIQAIEFDAKGAAWIGTKEGVFKISEDKSQNFTIADGLVSNDVRSIWVDQGKNEIWFGTSKNGISNFNGEVFINDSINIETSMGHGHIHAITGAEDEGIYFGSCISGLSKLKDTVWIHKMNNLNVFVNCYATAPDISLWVGTPYGLFHKTGENWSAYTRSDGLNSDNINSICVDQDNVVWIATEIGVMSLKAGVWESHFSANKQELKNIADIAVDSKGNLWAGGQGGLYQILK